jgi:hypothetical protein
VVDDVLVGGEHHCGFDDEGDPRTYIEITAEPVTSLSAPIM